MASEELPISDTDSATGGSLQARRHFLASFLAGGAAAGLPQLLLHAQDAPAAGERARGVVFHDRDRDGRMAGGDRGIEGVAVSNGRDVTLSDENGEWELPLLEGPATDFHVIPSRGWTVPLTADRRRRFHYLHQPAGSPELAFPGLRPSGPLPERIAFPLHEEEQGERFRVLVCGDPQPRNQREVGYLAQTVPGALAEEEAAFAVALGDIVFDRLNLFSALSGTLGASGHPWHYVIGNHDLNFDGADRFLSRQSYRRHFGPTAYAFNHGPAHFVVLDNIDWLGPDPEQPGLTNRYRGWVSEEQLEFLRNDLKHVPEDRLVVVFMHIPLFNNVGEGDRAMTLNRRALYEILKDRKHSLSFSAHTHTLQHHLIGEEDGWQGAAPHHHIISGALCGSWFRGAPGPDGVPQAVMSDGTPRGYLPLEIDGNAYHLPGFRAFPHAGGGQMHVSLENTLAAADAAGREFHVNCYNASERASVRARLGGGEWFELEKVWEQDPRVAGLHERDGALESPYRPAVAAQVCPHLWRGALPERVDRGTHRMEVVVDDGFGQTHRALAVFRVTA